MLDSLLTLLATKAKVGALVAGTALASTAIVGGGTVVLQNVGAASPVERAAVELSDSATPTVGIGTGNGKGRGAQNRSDTATAVLEAKDRPAETVTFTCDPTKNHGQNVSAYVQSLPKGPGRGELISQVAQSDCGKTVEDSERAGLEELARLKGADQQDEAAVEKTETSKPEKAKADKQADPAAPAKAAKPAKPAKPGKTARPDKAQTRGSSGKTPAGRG